MKFDKYVRKVAELANYNRGPVKGLVPAMWTSEEGAEVMREWRRSLKRDKPLDENKVQEEMGDVLLALANLANEMGYSLSDIADKSLEKLAEKVQ